MPFKKIKDWTVAKMLHEQLGLPCQVDINAEIEKVLPEYNRYPSLNYSSEELDDLCEAYAAEVVYAADVATVNFIRNSLTFKTQISFSKREFLTDRIEELQDAILDITQNNNIQWLLASSVVCVMLQAHGDKFKPLTSAGFKGPNGSMLIGTFDGVDVYTFLYMNPNGAKIGEDYILFGDSGNGKFIQLKICNFTFE